MRSGSSHRLDLRLSTVADSILDEIGEAFSGRWALAEAAVLFSVRNSRSFDPAFLPDGGRAKLRTSVDLRTTGRDPTQISATLHRELVEFAQRRRPSMDLSKPMIEVSAQLPEAAARELRIAAFSAGRSPVEELALRETVAALRLGRSFREESGPIREFVFQMPRDAFDRAHRAASSIGARRTIPATTQTVVQDLYAGVTV